MTDAYEKHRDMIYYRHSLLQTSRMKESEMIQASIRHIERVLDEDVELIIEAACDVTGTSRARLEGRSRKPPLPDIRHAIFYIAHTRGHRISHVSEMLNRDHTTGIHRSEEHTTELQ